MLDFSIKNALLVDGTGEMARVNDIGIVGDRIVEISATSSRSAARVIDAAGSTVAPGFIDVHIHADSELLRDGRFELGIRQGVTTAILGSDGIGLAPSSAPNAEKLSRHWGWLLGDTPHSRFAGGSVGEYLKAFNERTSVNTAYLLPHTAVRTEIVGWDDRRPDPSEMAAMESLVANAKEDGAVGFSTGLDYAPASYAEEEEFVRLAAIFAETQGPFVTHMRNYVQDVKESIAEAGRIAAQASVPLHISHLNVSAEEAIPSLDLLVTGSGVDFSFDTYPYLAGWLGGVTWLPTWLQEGGIVTSSEAIRDPHVREKLRTHFDRPRNFRWDDVQLARVAHRERQTLVGQSVLEAAFSVGQDVTDFVCDLLLDCSFDLGAFAFQAHRTWDDVRALIRRSEHMTSSDGIYLDTPTHPRSSGAFALFLRQFVEEEKLLPIEEAVRHMTSAPARRFGLTDRGALVEGAFADLVMFRPSEVRDTSTYQDPDSHAEGIGLVLVNGTVVSHRGRHTGALPGRGLRRGRPGGS